MADVLDNRRTFFLILFFAGGILVVSSFAPKEGKNE
jgi:hypothetical protein